MKLIGRERLARGIGRAILSQGRREERQDTDKL